MIYITGELNIILYMNKEQLYKQALETYSFDAQSRMVDEECAELINALCKYKRGRANSYDVITEIADVIIMCEQMAVYFGKEAVEKEIGKKLSRLEGRLNRRKYSVEDMIELWRIWECEMGESFMDYIGDNIINVKEALNYWKTEFPDLYVYLMNLTNNTIPWKYVLDSPENYDSLDFEVNNFYNVDEAEWFNEERYRKSILPWCSYLHKYCYDKWYEKFFSEEDEDEREFLKRVMKKFNEKVH